MKIVLFIGSISGGGAERVVCELSSYLVNLGNDVEIIAVTETTPVYPIDKGVRIRFLGFQLVDNVHFKYLRIIIKLFRLFTLINDCEADVYIAFLPEAIKALMLFRKFIKVPIIISERNDPSSYPDKLQKQLFRAASQANGIVFQTEFAERYYKKNFPNLEKSMIIPNALSKEFDIYNGENKEKIIVSVGRFSKQKNFQLLIKAFAKIVNFFPEYKLRIFGEGKLKNEYINLVGELGIAEKVEFPGYVKNIGKFLMNAELFVLSSDFEGIPNALLEAMALGLPCISTDCGGGGARFLIEDGVNGLLVPIGNVDAMATAMERLLTNKNLANMLGFNATHIKKIFAPEVIYQVWNEYINKVVKSHNS